MVDSHCIRCDGLGRVAIAGEDMAVPCPECDRGIAVVLEGNDRYRAIQRRSRGIDSRGERVEETLLGYGRTEEAARADLRGMHTPAVQR